MKRFFPEKILVEADVADLPLTRQVIGRCDGVPVETVASSREVILEAFHNRQGDFDGKKQLLLCRNRGRFLEPCPGTKPDYRCCGYVIVHTGTGCPLRCTYCVLQAYLNNPFITLYVNREDLLAELQSSPLLQQGAVCRLGTGEYMDSLALEHLTDFVPAILPFLHKHKNLVLELKTKTTEIDHLEGADHRGTLIVSWSLNAEEIVQTEELGAAPVCDRLAAAELLIAKGYRVGFHFDPLIYYPGWAEGYKKVIDMLRESISPEAVAWISIGSMRYMPALKQTALQQFPDTTIYSGEFIPGLDGKMRYLQDIRLEMYRRVTGWLREYSKDLCVYYCMESPHIWQTTMGFAPESNTALKRMLDQQVKI